MSFSPSFREISRQRGGKIELTVTRFAFSMPASRSASSNEERRSLCTPTPFVKKIAFGTNISCIVGNPLGPTGKGALYFSFDCFFAIGLLVLLESDVGLRLLGRSANATPPRE